MKTLILALTLAACATDQSTGSVGQSLITADYCDPMFDDEGCGLYSNPQGGSSVDLGSVTYQGGADQWGLDGHDGPFNVDTYQCATASPTCTVSGGDSQSSITYRCHAVWVNAHSTRIDCSKI